MGKRRTKYNKIEFAGVQHRIPAIYPGAKLTDDQKRKIGFLVCEIYETDLYTLEETVKFVGLGVPTFYRWIDYLEDLRDSFRDAQRLKYRNYKQRLTQRALTAAEELTRTGTYIKRTIEYEPVQMNEEQLKQLQKGNKDGLQLYAVKIKETTERYKPNAYATMAILHNMKSDTFERNPQPVVEDISIDEIPKLSWIQEGNEVEQSEYDDAEEIDELSEIDSDDDIEEYK